MAEAAYWTGDANLNWAGDDNSQPHASSSSSLSSSPYRGGDYYTISGRSNAGIGLGKIIIYGLVGMGFYWLFKKIGGK
jgi:hypothetical protein